MKIVLAKHKISKLFGIITLGACILLLLVVALNLTGKENRHAIASGYSQNVSTGHNPNDKRANGTTIQNFGDRISNGTTVQNFGDRIANDTKSIFTDDATVFRVTFVEEEVEGVVKRYFIVKTTDNKEIYKEETFLEKDVLSVIEKEIGNRKDENGKYRYKMNFGKPTVLVSVTDGKNSAPFSDSEDKLEYSVGVSHFMNQSGENIKWFAKYEKGDFLELPSKTDRKLFFGSKKDVGTYEIKCKVTYNILFDELIFGETADATSSGEITVNDKFDLSVRPTVKIEFGEFADFDLKNVLNDSRGVWAFMDTDDRTKRLSVGKHNINMSFVPINPNYSKRDDIEIVFEIKQRKIKIAVDNKSSVFGQPFVGLTYQLLSGLAYEDTVEDLGVELFKNSGEAAGLYHIYGSISNNSYSATFVNEMKPDGDFSVGGDYSILPNEVKFQLHNHALIAVRYDKGFPLSARLEVVHIDSVMPSDFAGKSQLISKIKLFVTDGGLPFQFESDFVVEISNIIDGATSVLYFDGGGWLKRDIVNSRVEIPMSALGEICFVSNYVLEVPTDWNAATIVFACLILLLTGVILILKKKFGGNK